MLKEVHNTTLLSLYELPARSVKLIVYNCMNNLCLQAEDPEARKLRQEKGFLGPRGYNIFQGAKDVYQGEKANRKARKK